MLPTNAVPNDRAGFTLEPLNGTIAKWIARSERPITMYVTLFAASDFVTTRITSMKIAEQKSSAKNAPRTPATPGTVAAFATSSLDVIRRRESAPSTAPRNCAIQYGPTSFAVIRRSRSMTSDTIGLKCPPETSPKMYRPTSSAIPKPNGAAPEPNPTTVAAPRKTST